MCLWTRWSLLVCVCKYTNSKAIHHPESNHQSIHPPSSQNEPLFVRSLFGEEMADAVVLLRVCMRMPAFKRVFVNGPLACHTTHAVLSTNARTGHGRDRAGLRPVEAGQPAGAEPVGFGVFRLTPLLSVIVVCVFLRWKATPPE